MRNGDGSKDVGDMNRILEAFAEEHPTPTARDIIEYKSLHPRYAEEIVELASLLLEGALHRGREEDHVVDATDVEVVARVFSQRRRHPARDLER